MNATEQGHAEDVVITARPLPIHLELVHDDDDARSIKGSVSCPLKGRVDVEDCSACVYSQGVRVTASNRTPEVLCGWLPTGRTA